MSNDDWWVYRGGADRVSPGQIANWLDSPPPWRRRSPAADLDRKPVEAMTPELNERGLGYVSTSDREVHAVNIALMLRRPLLVTGVPGVGKTTLVYHVARCLGLGDPLRWEINSQSTLREGLYHYDAVRHLNASRRADANPSIGDFITLGPLGTAMLPSARPRVLLIDELDKGSFDLPHDLLHVFEEGRFAIPELKGTERTHRVIPFDPRGEERVTVEEATVATRHHPVVVITSNGERVFPEAFMRRCVPFEIQQPTDAKVLAAIVRRQLRDTLTDEEITEAIEALRGEATDVLVQAIFLQHRFHASQGAVIESLKRRR